MLKIINFQNSYIKLHLNLIFMGFIINIISIFLFTEKENNTKLIYKILLPIPSIIFISICILDCNNKYEEYHKL